MGAGQREVLHPLCIFGAPMEQTNEQAWQELNDKLNEAIFDLAEKIAVNEFKNELSWKETAKILAATYIAGIMAGQNIVHIKTDKDGNGVIDLPYPNFAEKTEKDNGKNIE